MSTVLIIDDDPQVCDTLQSLVTRMAMNCHCASTLAEGTDLLKNEDVDVVFLDVRLPDGNGLDALPEIKASRCAPEVIILTGKGDPHGAELAIQGGVWDYLIKPSPVKQTRLTLQRAIAYRREKKSPSPVALNAEDIIGHSAVIRHCLDTVAMAATTDFSVLITGETGTGKELFARTIHLNSGRKERPFVVVDCAAMPEHLMESILFGHKKGAFTSAHEDQVGLIKQADGGTLFLDEIGELSPDAQKVFLRVLQEHRFRPVGARREIKSDFRLIAATNRNLAQMAEDHQFRKDLYYRLKSVSLELPPLRQRSEDIRALAIYHLNRLCEQSGLSNKGMDADFIDTISRYRWPGNIRELFHAVDQAFIAAQDELTLYTMHLPAEIRINVARRQLGDSNEPIAGANPVRTADSQNIQPSLPSDLMDTPLPTVKAFKLKMEKTYLEHLIQQTDGNLADILKTAQVSRSHFYALLKRHRIEY